jgi:hypothetical protein
VHKKILFPFSPGKSFDVGYTWAMELAARMNGALSLFTTVPTDEENNVAFRQHVYNSLLAAQGNYSQYVSRNLSPSPTEPHIGQGDFTGSLSQFLKTNRFDIVVIDPQASGLPKTALEEVVENSNGVIVLPHHQRKPDSRGPLSRQENEKKIAEAFYDVLHQSELYKIHDNFFRTLGRDQPLFNYLRSFFKRRGGIANHTG